MQRSHCTYRPVQRIQHLEFVHMRILIFRVTTFRFLSHRAGHSSGGLPTAEYEKIGEHLCKVALNYLPYRNARAKLHYVTQKIACILYEQYMTFILPSSENRLQSVRASRCGGAGEQDARGDEEGVVEMGEEAAKPVFEEEKGKA